MVIKMVGKRNTAERYQIKMTSIDETTVFIDGTHIKLTLITINVKMKLSKNQ